MKTFFEFISNLLGLVGMIYIAIHTAATVVKPDHWQNVHTAISLFIVCAIVINNNRDKSN